jgi:hypothetical protein
MKPFTIILAEKELKITPLDNGDYDVYSGRRRLCTIWPDEHLEWDDGQFVGFRRYRLAFTKEDWQIN